MFSLIRQYLETLSTPGSIQIYLYGLDTLRKHYGDGVIEFTESLVNQCKGLDRYDAIDKIYIETIGYIEKAIKEYGVFLNQDTLEISNIKTYIAILNGLIDIDEFDNTDIILNTINSYDSTEEILVHILSLVTQTDVNDFINTIEKVNSETVDKIKEVILERHILENKVEDTVVITNPLLPVYIKKYGINYLPEDLARHLTSVPNSLSLETLLKLYGNTITELNSDHLWLFISLVSRGSNTPEQLFNVWYKYHDDEQSAMRLSTRINILYQTLLEEYNKAEQQEG